MRFSDGDKVRIYNTGSIKLDGRDGCIRGISVAGLVNIWIVELDHLLTYVADGQMVSFYFVTLPDSCLERG